MFKYLTFIFLGLIEIINDPHECALDIFNNICKVIDDYKLKIENLTSFGADNTNVNFGEYHSVFKLLKDKLPHLVKGKCKVIVRLFKTSFFKLYVCITVFQVIVMHIFCIMQLKTHMIFYQLMLKLFYAKSILISRNQQNVSII